MIFSHTFLPYRILRKFNSHETVFVQCSGATRVKRHASFLPYRNLRKFNSHEAVFVQCSGATGVKRHASFYAKRT